MYKHVKIKADRVCKQCGKVLVKGTSCMTYSVKYGGRHWLCNPCFANRGKHGASSGECIHCGEPIKRGRYCAECMRLRKAISEAESDLHNLPFDDEGGAHAMIEFIDELKAEYEERLLSNE